MGFHRWLSWWHSRSLSECQTSMCSTITLRGSPLLWSKRTTTKTINWHDTNSDTNSISKNYFQIGLFQQQFPETFLHLNYFSYFIEICFCKLQLFEEIATFVREVSVLLSVRCKELWESISRSSEVVIISSGVPSRWTKTTIKLAFSDSNIRCSQPTWQVKLHYVGCIYFKML